MAESKLCYLLEQPEYPEIPKRKNSRVRPISREVDLAWLAGIIDGEGNLHALVQEKKSGTDRWKYLCPKIRITNTDVRMIHKVSEIYVREGLVFFYALNRVSRYQNKKPTWRDQLEITVGSQAGVVKLLKLVMPYLVNKSRYAEIMLETIEWVMSQPGRGRMSKKEPNYAESPQFSVFIEKLKTERANLIDPSTTTRRAGTILMI